MSYAPYDTGWLPFWLTLICMVLSMFFVGMKFIGVWYCIFNSIFNKGFSLSHSALDKLNHIMLDTINEKVWPWVCCRKPLQPQKQPWWSRGGVVNYFKNKKNTIRKQDVRQDNMVDFTHVQNGKFIWKAGILL